MSENFFWPVGCRIDGAQCPGIADIVQIPCQSTHTYRAHVSPLESVDWHRVTMQPVLAAEVQPCGHIYSTSTDPKVSEALVCGMMQPFSAKSHECIYQYAHSVR